MLNNFIKHKDQLMHKNLPIALLFAFVGVIGIVITRMGIKQKKASDIAIGVFIMVGALLFYFIEFF